MSSLAVLKFCREVIAEREQTDAWQGWFWSIRRKVIDYWIARLEEDPGSVAETLELSTEDQQSIRKSHPLLMPRSAVAGSAYELNHSWLAELHDRVHRYLQGVKARR